MFSQDQPTQQLTNLHTLNAALMRLNPAITGIDTSMLQTRGVTTAILNAVILADALTLYNGIKRADVINAIKPPLALAVNNTPITFAYDTHGDKHFPGGPTGTKFTGTAAVINPQLVNLIRPLVGRIRRDANGTTQTYYLTTGPTAYTGGQQLAIQVDYEVGPPERITYHGYPRAVTVIGLSRTLGGAPIAP
jgi:hypothetical protein